MIKKCGVIQYKSRFGYCTNIAVCVWHDTAKVWLSARSYNTSPQLKLLQETRYNSLQTM